MWRRFRNRVGEVLRRDFAAGLLTFVPIGFTILGVLWIVEQLDQLVLPKLFGALGVDAGKIPFLGVITTLAAILMTGALTRSFIGRAALGLWERLVERVPVARSLYSILKQFMQAIFGGSDVVRFRRVVLVEYPRKGIFTYAFVTGRIEDPPPGLPPGLLKIFVPSTPNPTTGYYLLISEDDVIDTGLSVEEAFQLIVSAGIASPNAAAPIDGAPADLPGVLRRTPASRDG